MTRPNDEQVGGTHYKDMAVQPWDYMRGCMSAEAFTGYLQGCCIKYLSRFHKKGGIEDLRKARHYLDKLIETKEVMQTEPAHRSSGINTVTAPAVSESAAGDWPGPDWSQAPDVSHFTHDRINGWKMGGHGIAFWLIGGGIWGQAPTFNYTGDWRDSLRERPK